MIAIRPAVTADAVAIAAVHVAAWRSTYPGILPDSYLAGMSVTRQAIGYERAIARGVAVHVAANTAANTGINTVGRGHAPIVGFATAAPVRPPDRHGRLDGVRQTTIAGQILGDGEVETLYVLDDWREHGVGRSLLAAVGRDLAAAACGSAYLWVLRDNPSRWFYQHMGGREAASAHVRVAGITIPQTAFVWNPIERLWGDTRC